MTTNIGKMAVQLTANAAPMVAELNKAQKALEQAKRQAESKNLSTWAKMKADDPGMGGYVASVDYARMDAMQKAADKVKEKAFKTSHWLGLKSAAGMAAGITAGFVAVPLAFAGGLVALAYKAHTFTQSLFKGLVKDADAAAQFGLSIGQMRTLMLAGGAAGEGMAKVVAKMEERFSGLANKSIEATEAFKGIGAMSGGGLDIGKLLGADRVGRYEMVFDALAKIEDAGKRVSAAYQLLGGEANAIIPMIEKGGEAFRRAGDTSKRFGLDASDGLAASARAALQFNANLQALKDGVMNQLVRIFAPVVEKISNAFDNSGIKFDNLAEKIVEKSKPIVEWGALIVDSWSHTGRMWELLKMGMEAFSLSIKKGVAEGLMEFRKLFKISDEWRKSMGMAAWVLSPGSAALMWVAGVGKKDPEKVASEAKGQLDDLWARFKKVQEDMSKAPAKTPFRDWAMGQLADIEKRIAEQKAKAKQEERERVNRQERERVANAYNSLAASNRTPLETFGETWRAMQQMEKFGHFASNPNLLARLQGKAFTDLMGAVPLPEYRMAGAALGNSREAYSAIARHQGSTTLRVTVQDQMKAILEESKRLQEEQNRIGREAADALRSLNAKIEVQ